MKRRKEAKSREERDKKRKVGGKGKTTRDRRELQLPERSRIRVFLVPLAKENRIKYTQNKAQTQCQS